MADKKDVKALLESQPPGIFKLCNVCTEVLPITAFYAHPKAADGHQGLCKECQKKRIKKNRADKLEHYLEFDRRRAFTPDRVEARRKYAATDHGKERDAEGSVRWIARNPEKRRAHTIVGNAIKSGNLVRQPCESCGVSGRVDAHHDDYSKPLEVRWMCRACHGRIHRRFDPETGKAIESEDQKQEQL